ncbi:hypothetical protein R69658_07671 [Paraburkholderia aspalathi]|uniref:Uncharacterized protein n=1 Tax=Paraburkholderia aspalathi TaxID=1324617 RepID=A0ABM8T7M9_9BURK|nr:hypothetical protein [Paraburkholderia aspalathi]MBK3823967.1 hypothetical protein [Paraburkholderia aspalathi]MBK3835808.1 hypothetical protein [Paraburkholderia aspalathi]MBK3865589.1 hypothetical protein [Paraburkholderia aspalathi]CAE6862140.1 hypothetical protein R69658_07671 [Paraburkholderia aspalathi]
MSKKFKGPLGKPIFVQPPGLIEYLESKEDALTKYSKAVNVARAEKLSLLFEHYGIQQGDFAALAMALASDLVQGFKVTTERNQVGRPTKWDGISSGYLVVEIERLIEKNPHLNVTSAAAHLAKRDPWMDFVGGKNPAERLRQQYEEVEHDKWAKVCRDAFRAHEAEGTVDEWDKSVLALGS